MLDIKKLRERIILERQRINHFDCDCGIFVDLKKKRVIEINDQGSDTIILFTRMHGMNSVCYGEYQCAYYCRQCVYCNMDDIGLPNDFYDGIAECPDYVILDYVILDNHKEGGVECCSEKLSTR